MSLGDGVTQAPLKFSVGSGDCIHNQDDQQLRKYSDEVLSESIAGSEVLENEADLCDQKDVQQGLSKRKDPGKLGDASSISEQRFRALFEQSNDAILFTDLKLVLLEANQQAAQLLGYQVAELINVDMHQLIALEELDAALEMISIILTGGSFPVQECTLVRKNGKRVPTEVSVSVVNDAHGLPLYIQFIARDVSERKRIELALKEERALLRTLIDNIPAFIFAKDDQGRFILNNKTHLRALGAQTQSEVYGKTDLEIIPAELAEQSATADNAVLTLGFPIMDKEEIFEKQDTGEKIWISATKAPIKNDEGKVTGLVGICTDVTERKRVEVALRESEEKFRLLSAQSLLGILILQNGTVKYCNQAACALLEYDEAQVLGWDQGEFNKIFHPEEAEFALDQLNKSQSGEQGGLIPNYACRVITNSGRTIWVDQYSKTIHYEGNPACLVTLVDITERKLAEERLQHLATHDPLTDLPNRILFFDRLKHALALARRNGSRVALLFIDLDEFKAINDEFGHENGDMVLRELAGRLQAGARASDSIARLAGDEFIYILENVSEEIQPAVIAIRLLSRISEPFIIDGVEVTLSASIGISIFPDDGEEPSELLRKADIAMYRNKDLGKNGYEMFS
jgi:diguanylate cyclase (GGDEF)-like protein/PAS domain S-box-containing protein